jgi:hypothetical protein
MSPTDGRTYTGSKQGSLLWEEHQPNSVRSFQEIFASLVLKKSARSGKY